MPKEYRMPMYARVLGWAANWSPKKGSLTEAILEDVKFWGSIGAKIVKGVVLKFKSNKKKKEDKKEVDE